MVLKTKNGEAMTEIEDKEGCQHNKEVVSKQRETRFHLNLPVKGDLHRGQELLKMDPASSGGDYGEGKDSHRLSSYSCHVNLTTARDTGIVSILGRQVRRASLEQAV